MTKFKQGDRVIYGIRTPENLTVGFPSFTVRGIRGRITEAIQVNDGQVYYEIHVSEPNIIEYINDTGEYIELDTEYYYGL